MIRKWTTRFIVYMLITVFLAVIGYYLAASIASDNKKMDDLKNTGTRTEAKAVKLSSVSYTEDDTKYRWGYIIPDELLPESYKNSERPKVDGVTTYSYSIADIDQMGDVIEVYFMFNGNEIVTFEAEYVESFVHWTPVQSIFLFVIAGITFAVALMYLIMNFVMMNIAAKGEQSVGTFVEATHPKVFSSRYYKIKYTYVKDGETVSAVSPAIYDGKQVDKLSQFGLFNVRYKGKRSVIDEKL